MAPKIHLLGPKKQSDTHLPSKDNDAATSASVTRSDKKNGTNNMASTENGETAGEKKKSKKKLRINALRAYYEGSTRKLYHIWIRSQR
jgi:hypothetical protein